VRATQLLPQISQAFACIPLQAELDSNVSSRGRGLVSQREHGDGDERKGEGGEGFSGLHAECRLPVQELVGNRVDN
jgi:hypothetical protein